MTAPQRLSKLHAINQSGGRHRQLSFQEALSDPDDIVRHEACFLLGDLKKTGALFDEIEAEKFLIASLLNDVSILVRHEAALSLANFKTESAVIALLEAARPNMAMDRSVPPEVFSSVRYSLIQMVCG